MQHRRKRQQHVRRSTTSRWTSPRPVRHSTYWAIVGSNLMVHLVEPCFPPIGFVGYRAIGFGDLPCGRRCVLGWPLPFRQPFQGLQYMGCFRSHHVVQILVLRRSAKRCYIFCRLSRTDVRLRPGIPVGRREPQFPNFIQQYPKYAVVTAINRIVVSNVQYEENSSVANCSTTDQDSPLVRQFYDQR